MPASIGMEGHGSSFSMMGIWRDAGEIQMHLYSEILKSGLPNMRFLEKDGDFWRKSEIDDLHGICGSI